MKSAYITGVYNYCDRWCQRCTLTSHCSSYEHAGNFSPEQTDNINLSFWQQLDELAKQGVALLKKASTDYAIDISEENWCADAAAYEKKLLSFREATRNHPLSNLCKRYQQMVIPFLESKENISYASLIADTANNIIINCRSVIQWYLFLIDAKLQRALHGKMDDDSWETESGIPKDSDGSAKIALISIQRSIAAWVQLLTALPASEDTALPALAILQQLQKITEETFPKAMQFKRPGFDQ